VPRNRRHVDLVLEGGGIRGLALVGAFRAMCDRGICPVNVAGTSAGSIVGAMIAAGYTATELEELAVQTDFQQLIDPRRRWLPRHIRAAVNILVDWGVCAGDAFEAWIQEKLAAKGIRTFGDLSGGIRDRGSRSRLRVVVSDVTRGRMVVIPDDLPAYGVDPDRFSVATAVRMSASIPLFFRPCFLPAFADNPSSLVVDGGLLSNYPIGIFDSGDDAIRPTLGVRLRSSSPHIVAPRRLHGYLAAVISTMTCALDQRDIQRLDDVRSIYVPIDRVGVTSFHLTQAERRDVCDQGARAAGEFLDRWMLET
jgi:NTE family protein